VLLGDLDLRRPGIQHYFVNEEHLGISDYLVDDANINDILINPDIERLVILPGNHSFTNSSEMLSSPKMVRLVEELKGRYANRIILFDMPPLLSCDDVIAFSPYVDAIMLVVEEGGTRKDDLKRAYDLIAEKNLVGTVLNKSEDRISAYGYY
jgi:Mrp family chromosome partitioning ATPase